MLWRNGVQSFVHECTIMYKHFQCANMRANMLVNMKVSVLNFLKLHVCIVAEIPDLLL